MEDRSGLVFYDKPALRNPAMLVAWGCIGYVGIDSLVYLAEWLKPRKFAEIKPYDFFDVEVSVEGAVVTSPPPNITEFFFWKNEAGNDVIMCVASAEPSRERQRYTELVLDVAQEMGVTSIYTVCATTDSVNHKEETKLRGVVNHPRLVSRLMNCGIEPFDVSNLVSMNALLLAVAKQRGIPAIYLLGRVPRYMAQISNPKVVGAVVRTLCAMLNLPLDMQRLDRTISRAQAEVDKQLRKMSHDFIEKFTVDYRDIWGAEDGK